jgi:hypothetical protein
MDTWALMIPLVAPFILFGSIVGYLVMTIGKGQRT